MDVVRTARTVLGQKTNAFLCRVNVGDGLSRVDLGPEWNTGANNAMHPTAALFPLGKSSRGLRRLLSAWSGVRAWTFPITRFSLSPRNDATTGIGSH